ncbi:MAG: NTP transferase domain-containing protein, partial [Spirochaetia bacterium]|nr:NTP transferase domain-containing protein [Spirochaetia bacterium]
MAKRPVTGVVLCGGYSTRMGSDKGLLCAGNGPPLAAVAFEKLIQICSQVVVSIREEQRGAYNAIL